MKKILFALALTLIGGASLSTASTANAAPAPLASIGQIQDAKGEITPVHYRKHYHHYRGHYRYRPYYYSYNSDWYPPYKGFCYDNPYHWWCKRHFHKGY